LYRGDAAGPAGCASGRATPAGGVLRTGWAADGSLFARLLHAPSVGGLCRQGGNRPANRGRDEHSGRDIGDRRRGQAGDGAAPVGAGQATPAGVGGPADRQPHTPADGGPPVASGRLSLRRRPRLCRGCTAPGGRNPYLIHGESAAATSTGPSSSRSAPSAPS